MVEVGGGRGKQERLLRDKALKLAWELEQADRKMSESAETFRGAVRLMAGLLRGALPKPQQQALQKLMKTMAKEPLDLEKLRNAVSDLKDIVVSAPVSSDPLVKKDEASGAPLDTSAAGRHVALALLEGLRLGNAEFDARLELDIRKINKYITTNQVRPAMSVLVDLLDMFREVQEKRRLQAENALKEILSEVLKTEDGLARVVDQTQREISSSNRTYDEKINASVGNLAQAISQAGELETLKATALEHLKSIRDGVRERQSQEKNLLERTRKQLDLVKKNLSEMRQRVRQVEEDSERLNKEALTDPLTNIWNKRAFTRDLKKALVQPSDWPVCLIVLDIDKFKSVNDNYGHQAGDRALIAITERTRSCLRKKDTFYRYAGDEFVILLKQTPIKEAMMVAERVRQATANIRFTFRGEGELRITVSMGVSEAKAGDNLEDLFERADQALLSSKRAGRDQVSPS